MVRLSKKHQILGALVLLAVIGLLTSKMRMIGVGWGFGVLLAGLLLTLYYRNANGEAHLFAGYLMGAEVFFRMTKAGMPWEFSKYAIIMLLTTGLIFGRDRRGFPLLIIFYFVMLLPAIYLSFEYFDTFLSARKAVVFNLLAPLALMISVLYFYRMEFTIERFAVLSRWIVAGVFTMAMLVLFNVGDYTSMDYGFSSNAGSSGGFSGNQVSTVFGVGVLVLGVNLVLGTRLFYYGWLDKVIFLLFIFQGLMTFSRGGMMGGVLGVALGSLFFFISNKKQFMQFMRKKVWVLAAAIVLGLGGFIVADDITGGKLYARYFNVDKQGYKLKESYSTGRAEIAEGDIMLFEGSNYMGVGPGVSAYERPLERGLAAHVEYSRLLADHGVLGIVSLLVLFWLPIQHFFRQISHATKNLILVSMVVFALFTMTHAAMRLGMVPFTYAMGFITIVRKKDDEK